MRIATITGMARSGTSWLGKIFASHPEVLYHFEPFDKKKERKRLPKNLCFHGLLEKINAVDKERAEVRVNMLSTALHAFYDYRGHKLDRKPHFKQPENPRMMIIKSPKAIPVIGVFAHFGPVIYIIRDPRAMIHSLWQTEFGKSYPAYGTARKWDLISLKFMLLEQEWPESFKVVRFEDIVGDPETVSRQMANAIDLPWMEEMARFLEWSRSGHDEHMYALKKDPELVINAWKRGLSESAQRQILKTVEKSAPWGKYYGI
jgi:hypothetical protein